MRLLFLPHSYICSSYDAAHNSTFVRIYAPVTSVMHTFEFDFFFMKVYYVLVILNILLAIPNSVCTKVLYISFCVYKCICIIILCAFLPFRGTRTIFVCLCKKYMDVDIFFFVYLHCRHFFKSCIIVSLNVSYMGLV